MIIRPADRSDLSGIERMLEGAGLPVAGLRSHLEHFLVAEEEGALCGAIGLEVYGAEALLRSLVVEPALRGKGIGDALYRRVQSDARALGVRRLVLLTTTAEAYFAARGFRRMDRATVAGPMAASAEFRGACPDSAVCMGRSWTSILILCTGNSCRSQMAEAFLRSMDDGLDVYSAGTHPAARVHPMALAVMGEIGFGLANARPKSVEPFLEQEFDYVITVCDHARETCPAFVGKVRHRLHISFEDPVEAVGSEEAILGKFREVRDQIRERFARFHGEIRRRRTGQT